MALFYGDQGAPGGVAAAPVAPKIQIDKAPVVGAVKGLPGLAGNSPWTDAQRAAGMRREIPLGYTPSTTGLGTNRVAPPPLPPRQQLAQMLAPWGNQRHWAEGWGGEGGGWGSGRVGYGGGYGNSRSSVYGGGGGGWGSGFGQGGAGGGMGGYSSGGLY